MNSERDNELEKRKQAAYERGQDWGYANKSWAYAEQLGYQPNSDEHLAYLPPYSKCDGRANCRCVLIPVYYRAGA